MITKQYSLKTTTPGRGLIDITAELSNFTSQSTVTTGLCHVFLHHTSASLLICENSDPVVQHDFERFLQRLIPDGDSIFKHTDEGPDDMPSHVRTMLTQTFITVPITQKHLALGTWQGIYLFEHRIRPHDRKITITIQGE